jgi:hypothetical protein
MNHCDPAVFRRLLHNPPDAAIIGECGSRSGTARKGREHFEEETPPAIADGISSSTSSDALPVIIA